MKCGCKKVSVCLKCVFASRKLAKTLNSGFWKANMLTTDKILYSGRRKPKILRSAKILNSGLWKAKILKRAKILYSGFRKPKILNFSFRKS